jgi:hypothetical protein
MSTEVVNRKMFFLCFLEIFALFAVKYGLAKVYSARIHCLLGVDFRQPNSVRVNYKCVSCAVSVPFPLPLE